MLVDQGFTMPLSTTVNIVSKELNVSHVFYEDSTIFLNYSYSLISTKSEMTAKTIRDGNGIADKDCKMSMKKVPARVKNESVKQSN